MNGTIAAYIEDLFRYLDSYEGNRGAFETEAFLQTYNGIGAVFQALREQRDKAIEVDRIFLERIQQRPLNSSDLRQLTIQIMISFFESIADSDNRSGNSYNYCRKLRDVHLDVPYFETVLMPLLTRDGSLNNDFALNRFFLQEIGRYIRKFGDGVGTDSNFEDFRGMPTHQKLLTLSLRRAELGEDIINDRDSLEFHMRSVGVFEKLAQESTLADRYLQEWDYLVQAPSFFDRLNQFFAVVGAKLRGSASSSNYMRLSLLQRSAGYALSWLIIAIFVFLAIFVPVVWNKYTQIRLEKFKVQVEETRQALGK